MSSFYQSAEVESVDAVVCGGTTVMPGDVTAVVVMCGMSSVVDVQMHHESTVPVVVQACGSVLA